jgi:heme/copper-type cytochrome/quinol oxidase subunit 2
MNENLVQASPAQPLSNQGAATAPVLWNPEAAGGWSLIFNPVFGSILVLMNWQALKVPEKVRSAQIWLAVSILVLIGSIFVPRSVFSVVTIGYLLIWYFSSAKPQAKYIKERWGGAYPRRSWLWPLLIAFGILFAFLCLIFVLTFAQAALSQ